MVQRLYSLLANVTSLIKENNKFSDVVSHVTNLTRKNIYLTSFKLIANGYGKGLFIICTRFSRLAHAVNFVYKTFTYTRILFLLSWFSTVFMKFFLLFLNKFFLLC